MIFKLSAVNTARPEHGPVWMYDGGGPDSDARTGTAVCVAVWRPTNNIIKYRKRWQ